MVKEEDNLDINNEDFSQFVSTSNLYPAFSALEARNLYNRNAIAFKANERYTGDVTKENYEIKGAFGELGEELNFKSILKLGSTFAYRDGYSLIYLKFTDSGDYIDPVETLQTPVKLEIIPRSWVINTPDDRDANGNRLTYYEIEQKDGSDSIKIDESRIVQLYFRQDKQSMYLPAWNSLWAADLTMWNIGQAYFRTAGGMYHLIVKGKGKTTALTAKKISNDKNIAKIDSSTLFVSGENKELKNIGIGGGFPDPQKSYEIPLMTASTGLKIPWQLLVGTNAGAITGSETNIKEYFSMVQNFRIIWITDIIHEIELKSGLKPSELVFGTLFEETDLEKAAMIENYSKAFKDLLLLGVYSREGVNEYMNTQLGVDLPLGEVLSTNTTQSNDLTLSDKIDIAQPKVLPNEKSVLESDKVMIPESKEITKEQKLLKKIILDYNFTKEIKSAYKTINVKDGLFDKSIYMDNTDKLKGLIDVVVDTFKIAGVASISEYFDETWPLGLSIAFNKIKKDKKDLKPFLPSERTKNIQEILRGGVGGSIVGATDDMRRDLKRVVEEAILTGTNPTVAAREFAKYVDEDFANKYNNRLRTIVQSETGNIIGQANIREMEDSGVVKYHQWITARDSKVRPTHQIHGEVVELGKPFSNGLTYGGQEINCRCDSIPYFTDN